MPTLFDTLPRSVPAPASCSGSPQHPDGSPPALSSQERGAIFTRVEVVDFILDLIGYTSDKPLASQRILEPSCGHGDFVLPIIRRLLLAWQKPSGRDLTVEMLGNALLAIELDAESCRKTRQAVQQVLREAGFDEAIAHSLSAQWIRQDDFLLASIEGTFEYVAGNPPYVRQELLSDSLMAQYRQRYSTIYDRADLYIPFMQRSLQLLSPQGHLGFICADRWTKNRYGGPLRDFIARGYSLDIYVDMTDTPAFHEEVSAYPAITVISKHRQGATSIAHRPAIDSDALQALSRQLLAGGSECTVHNVVNGSDPWLLDSSDQHALLRRLEAEYPLLEQAGCKVGIGVATGADKAFIGDMATMDVEPDRVLPLVATKDIGSGEVVWQGKGLINPFRDDGVLVPLEAYPRLSRYLQSRRALLEKRHCARNNPGKWYRTIDRIWLELASTPKLLIPDIKGEAHVVYEDGSYYPHHNLYYVLSGEWDLRALQAVLLSSVAKMFVASYSTKMRGGYIRFQAQYLRRIRIPYWQDVPEELRLELIAAAKTRDLNACNKAVFRLYGLSHHERSAIGGNGA